MVRFLPAATFLAFMVSQLLAVARTAPPAPPFQRIEGCVYKPKRWNDGDSFHVILPGQKQLIFLIYSVDAQARLCERSELGNNRATKTDTL
jgi:hypothetical protein